MVGVWGWAEPWWTCGGGWSHDGHKVRRLGDRAMYHVTQAQILKQLHMYVYSMCIMYGYAICCYV